MTDRCPRCGALILPQERFCSQCGAALASATASAPAKAAAEASAAPVEPPAQPLWTGGVPKTVEELQSFCAQNEMPLEKMRFFIGVDYRQPRAFGIYRDGDELVVYKNKADGSRTVRYHGPDEAWAVKELYDKLLDECHSRDIWPGGKPREVVVAQRKAKRRQVLLIAGVVVLLAAVAIFAVVTEILDHRHDGYYRAGANDTYYRYGDDWYYYDVYDDWVPVDDFYYADYEDYYLGDDYDRAWGGGDFRESDTWQDLHRSDNTSSGDYSSWDSGDTDWSSDW